MRLATLKFEIRLRKRIRMGITIFKILIWGGISSDIRWEFMSYGFLILNHMQGQMADKTTEVYTAVCTFQLFGRCPVYMAMGVP